MELLGILEGTPAVTGCRGTRAVSPSGKAPGTTLRWKADARILCKHPAREAAAGGGGGQRCGGREGAKPSGWNAAGAGDRDWPEDGAGSAERNPDQKAAGGVTRESLRRADITPPATPRDVPAVRRTLGASGVVRWCSRRGCDPRRASHSGSPVPAFP